MELVVKLAKAMKFPVGQIRISAACTTTYWVLRLARRCILGYCPILKGTIYGKI